VESCEKRIDEFGGDIAAVARVAMVFATNEDVGLLRGAETSPARMDFDFTDCRLRTNKQR